MPCPLGLPFLRTKHGNVPSRWPSNEINWQNVAKGPLWTPFGRKKIPWRLNLMQENNHHLCQHSWFSPRDHTLLPSPDWLLFSQNSPTSLPIYDKISDLLFAQPIPGTDRLNSIVSGKLRVFYITKVSNISRTSLCATVFNLVFASASEE